MNKLKYIVFGAALLSAAMINLDAYAQRRGGGRGNQGGGGGNRPAPQFSPAPQMRIQQPQPQVRVQQPQVRTPAATGGAGVNTTSGVRVNDGNVRVRTDGSAAANTGIRSATIPNARAGANVNNQAIVRNNINIGQKTVPLAPNTYRPAYQNYPWHNGYWNNSYGWNPMIGSGAGYYGNYGGYGIRLGNFGIGTGGYGGLGGYGGYGYGRYPMGWGYGGWGLGNMMYGSGYMPYFNPYWGSGLGGGLGGGGYAYNYAQPIYVNTNAPATSDIATQDFDSARDAFKAGDYNTALKLVDRAIKENPSDGVLHEFRALTLFAMKDYKQSAATIHSVLAVGPGWDWATMASLYPDVETYTAQLRALENFTKAHTDDAASQFLLGYHYMTTSHPEAAAKEFANVVKLEPKDGVAKDLLALVDKPKDGDVVNAPAPRDAAADSAPVAKPDENVRPINADAIAGHWQSSREDGSKFDVDMRKDKTFTWKFSQGSHNEEFSGTYSTEGSLLILQKQDGGTMVGHVTQDADGKFNFKMLGAPADDPGLTFTR